MPESLDPKNLTPAEAVVLAAAISVLPELLRVLLMVLGG